MTIRFHLDEHIHPGIAIGLRARGLDVTTTQGGVRFSRCDIMIMWFLNGKERDHDEYESR
jgi:hypothetical protein